MPLDGDRNHNDCVPNHLMLLVHTSLLMHSFFYFTMRWMPYLQYANEFNLALVIAFDNMVIQEVNKFYSILTMVIR